MSLTPDQMIDRIKTRRQLVNWRSMFLIAAFLLILALFGGKEVSKVPVISGEYVARIYIDDVIFDDHYRLESIDRATKDNSIKGVIVHVNSPGGTVVGGENLYYALRRLSETKPVVVVMGDLAASAGYMVSVAADHIVARSGSVLGSIGVIAQTFEAVDLAEKLGVKFYNFKSSPLKGGVLPTEKVTPEQIAAMDSVINDIYQTFFNMVLHRRDIEKHKLQKLADGRVFTGNQGLENGLIDQIGGEFEAIEWLKKEKGIPDSIKVIDYKVTAPENNFSRFLESMYSAGNLVKMFVNSKTMYIS